ncbi:MAG: hypothetical protein AAF357_15195 [Verrucomicrobiota bacterium]
MNSASLKDRIQHVRAGIRSRQPIAFRIETVRRKVSRKQNLDGLRSRERQFEER